MFKMKTVNAFIINPLMFHIYSFKNKINGKNAQLKCVKQLAVLKH